MYEVEIKVRADHAVVRNHLHGLEAIPGGTVRQVDTYYDAPHRDFAETDEAVRVREEVTEHDESTAITYKGPLIDDTSKSREEHQTRVQDRDAIEGILEGLGFEPAATVEKDAREGAEGILQSLGLDPDSGIRTSYLGLLLEDDT
jgi:adenylate cyclase class 2